MDVPSQIQPSPPTDAGRPEERIDMVAVSQVLLRMVVHLDEQQYTSADTVEPKPRGDAPPTNVPKITDGSQP